MSGEPDYESVHVKAGLRPEEYGWRQRRADLLRRIKEAGGVAMLNKSELAREYDVARSTLYNDLERLAEYADESLGERESLDGEALYGRALRKLLSDADALRQQGKHAKAASVEKEAARVFKWQSEWRMTSELDDLLERVEALEEGTREARSGSNDFRIK